MFTFGSFSNDFWLIWARFASKVWDRKTVSWQVAAWQFWWMTLAPFSDQLTLDLQVKIQFEKKNNEAPLPRQRESNKHLLRKYLTARTKSCAFRPPSQARSNTPFVCKSALFFRWFLRLVICTDLQWFACVLQCFLKVGRLWFAVICSLQISCKSVQIKGLKNVENRPLQIMWFAVICSWFAACKSVQITVPLA